MTDSERSNRILWIQGRLAALDEYSKRRLEPLGAEVVEESPTDNSLNLSLNRMSFEREIIVEALRRSNGYIDLAAEIIGITPRKLSYKCATLAVKIKPDYKVTAIKRADLKLLKKIA